MAPHEQVLMAFKLQWLCGKDGCYQINPGINSEDFKNLTAALTSLRFLFLRYLSILS